MIETSEQQRTWKDEVFTWANLVSVLRLAAVPVFVWLLLGEERRLAAAGLLAVIGATDWIDGYLARRFNQVSEVGKILDPTADRLLFLVAIVAMIIDESVPLWFAVATLLREVVVALAAIVLGIMGARRIDVTWWGKTSTFGLMFAFPLFLASHTGVGWAGFAEVAAYAIGVPSLILHYYAGFSYIPLAINALREGRAAPQPPV
ncbi:MAG: CDP-alcohol phosphatidyltransferase family protein [Acidimicrobiia bacterium]